MKQSSSTPKALRESDKEFWDLANGSKVVETKGFQGATVANAAPRLSTRKRVETAYVQSVKMAPIAR